MNESLSLNVCLTTPLWKADPPQSFIFPCSTALSVWDFFFGVLGVYNCVCSGNPHSVHFHLPQEAKRVWNPILQNYEKSHLLHSPPLLEGSIFSPYNIRRNKEGRRRRSSLIPTSLPHLLHFAQFLFTSHHATDRSEAYARSPSINSENFCGTKEICDVGNC